MLWGKILDNASHGIWKVGIKISPVIKIVFQHYFSKEKYVFLNNFDILSFIIKMLYAIKIFRAGSFGS